MSMLVCTRKDLNSARGCLKILIALWHIFKGILMIPMTPDHQYDQLQQWCLCAALQVGAPQDLVAGGVVHPMIVVEEVVSLGTEIGLPVQVLDQVEMTTEIEAIRMIKVDCHQGPTVVVVVDVVVVGDVVEEIMIMTDRIQIMALKSGVLRKVEEEVGVKFKIHLPGSLGAVVVEVVLEVVVETEVVGVLVLVVVVVGTAGGRTLVVRLRILAGVAVKSPVAAEGGDQSYSCDHVMALIFMSTFWMYYQSWLVFFSIDSPPGFKFASF